MQKLLFLVLSVTLLNVPGSGAPCSPGSVASYIAMASAGCELGSLRVSHFAYKSGASGGAAKITADQITVTPLLVPGNYSLQFAAPWSVESGQKQASDITYQVASSNTELPIQEVRLDGTGFKAGLIGSVVVNQAFATPTITHSLEVYLKCTDACRAETSADVPLTPAAGALVVVDRVKLDSGQGDVSMTSFTDWLVVCLPCV